MKESNRLVVQLGKIEQLHKVHPPLAGFALGNERLRTAQHLRYLDLCQPRLLSCFPEKTEKFPIMLGVLFGLQALGPSAAEDVVVLCFQLSQNGISLNLHLRAS